MISPRRYGLFATSPHKPLVFGTLHEDLALFSPILVRARGLEPLILSEPDPKSGVSAIPPRAHTLVKLRSARRNLKSAFAAHDCADKKVNLPSRHVVLDSFGFGRGTHLARRRIEQLLAGGAESIRRGKGAAFCAREKSRQPDGLSGRNRGIRGIARSKSAFV